MSPRSRSLLRAIALAAAVVFLAPLSPIVLVCVPTGVVLLAARPRSTGSLLLAAGLLIVAFLGAGEPTPLWYAERAWGLLVAGAFVLWGVFQPGRGLVARSAAAVGTAFGIVAAFGTLRPRLLAEVDWWIAAQFDRAALAAYQWFRVGGEAWTAVADAVRTVVEMQTVLYPALLGLGTLCALGVASYVADRMAGSEGRLAPLREFRFSDQLVWLLVAGLVLFILPIGQWATRVGENVMAFMGALYLLRGAAVLTWLGAAVATSGWSTALLLLAAVLFYPVALGAALVMGLSDTWLDLRNRLGVDAGGDAE